jgi:hypothetical protein
MSRRIFIDLETIPDQDPGAFDKYLGAVEPPGNIRKPESIDKWFLENAERVALEKFQKTALNGLHGEICSIAWAIDDGEIHNEVRLGGEIHNLESELLEKFWDQLYTELRELGGKDGNWPKVEWVGHNVIDFDLRFLKQRCIINQVEPHRFIPADARHGTGQVFDTMKEWSGFRGYVKQDDLCDALGIAAPAWAQHVAATDGSQVWELWRNGDYDLLALYNKLDVFKVREIYKRMHYR